MFRFLVLIGLGCIIFVTGMGQSRQADSLRIKQELYWKQLKEREEKAREAAQQKSKAAPTVVTTYDSHGRKIETKTNNQDKTITKIITMGPPLLNRPFNADTIDKDSIVIKVIKSKNRLQVYYKGKAITAYKCVFGPNHVGQKLQEGDRRTPEGTFTIIDSKKHDKWDTFMLLDYPNEASTRNFEEAKANGLIPANARIGGAIGIHGIWPNGDNVIEMGHHWTDGCVALRNQDIQLLNTIIKPGTTQIIILK